MGLAHITRRGSLTLPLLRQSAAIITQTPTLASRTTLWIFCARKWESDAAEWIMLILQVLLVIAVLAVMFGGAIVGWRQWIARDRTMASRCLGLRFCNRVYGAVVDNRRVRIIQSSSTILYAKTCSLHTLGKS